MAEKVLDHYRSWRKKRKNYPQRYTSNEKSRPTQGYPTKKRKFRDFRAKIDQFWSAGNVRWVGCYENLWKLNEKVLMLIERFQLTKFLYYFPLCLRFCEQFRSSSSHSGPWRAPLKWSALWSLDSSQSDYKFYQSTLNKFQKIIKKHPKTITTSRFSIRPNCLTCLYGFSRQSSLSVRFPSFQPVSADFILLFQIHHETWSRSSFTASCLDLFQVQTSPCMQTRVWVYAVFMHMRRKSMWKLSICSFATSSSAWWHQRQSFSFLVNVAWAINDKDFLPKSG